MIEAALDDALRRARVDLAGWREEGGRVYRRRDLEPRRSTSAITRYLDRSSTFENAQVEVEVRRRR